MQESDKYKVELGQVYYLDQAQNHARIVVTITDKLTGKIHNRIGDGRAIGNYFPVFINWKGEKIQLTQLLEA